MHKHEAQPERKMQRGAVYAERIRSSLCIRAVKNGSMHSDNCQAQNCHEQRPLYRKIPAIAMDFPINFIAKRATESISRYILALCCHG